MNIRILSVLLFVSLPVAAVATTIAEPVITDARFTARNESIVVELNYAMKTGYIQYERWGSGNGYDYSAIQYRADGKSEVELMGIGKGFRDSGTSGKQTITLAACYEGGGVGTGSFCGPTYTLTVDLQGSLSFSDVPATHPNAEAIRHVQREGIVAGYPDGTFKPNSTINRAEFTKIITLALYGQEMVDECGTVYPFWDVPRDAWYVKHVCRARDGWLLTGYPDGSFKPAQSINFSEAAKILVNGYGLVDRTDHCNGKLCPDVDTPEHPWYEQYVRALAQHNAIPLSILTLDEPITRGEMAEIIWRLEAHVTGEPSKTYEELSGSSRSSSSFSLSQYGFGISAFDSSDCTWTNLGPNDAQQRIDAGEQISGTTPPARVVYSFHCPDDIAPDFELYVYERHDAEISMDGACGTQFASENIVSRSIVPDGPGPSYFEVIQKLIGGGQQADYCFDAGNNTMITLRWKIDDYGNHLDAMETVADSVELRFK